MYKEALYYFFEYIISNMMIPGQIENWVFIMDFDDIGVLNMTVNFLILSKIEITRIPQNYHSCSKRKQHENFQKLLVQFSNGYEK
jgi:hypothetical protein